MRASSILCLTSLCAALVTGFVGAAACRSEPFPYPMTDDAFVAPIDSSTSAGDMAPVPTFRCGKSTCAFPQVCCTADVGVTGSCLAVSQCQLPADRYVCDGPLACPNSGDCCYSTTTGANCVPAGLCPSGNLRLCKVKADCHGNETCCTGTFGRGPQPYGICSSGPCPL